MAGHLNVELKARCPDPARVRRVLEAAGAEFAGSIASATSTTVCPTGASSCGAGRSSAR